MSAATRPGFSVKGVRFRSPAEARAAARRLRDDAEEYASEMRKRGQDAKAEQVVDQAGEQADAYDTAASEHDTQPSPKPAPATASRRPTSRSGGRGRRGSSRPSLPRPQMVGGWGELVMWVVVSMVLVAVLRLVVGTTRGPNAYAWLVGKAAGLFQVIVAPVDPLAGFPAAPVDPAVAMANKALPHPAKSKLAHTHKN